MRKLYIDGVQQNLTQRLGTPTAVSAANWASAGANGSGNNDWTGRIDELSIYNTGLSQARVTAHYNAANSFSATYAYNGDGLRQSKTVGSTTNQMLWDTSGDLPQLLTDGEYTFVYGPDGLPVSQFDPAGNIAWFGHDTQANTRTLFPNHGAAGARLDYDPYGNTINSWGGRDTRLKFQSQYEDTETELLYLRARYHDPKTNQFISVDPLVATSRSAYGYANNDGVNYSDPTGLIFEWNPRDALSRGGNWLTNPVGQVVDTAASASRAVTSQASSVWNTNVGGFDYGTTAAAAFNIGYGGFKIAVGVPATRAGLAGMFVPGAQAPAAGVTAYGVYNVITGSARAMRGAKQAWGLTTGDPLCGPTERTLGANFNRFIGGVGPSFAEGHGLGDLP